MCVCRNQLLETAPQLPVKQRAKSVMSPGQHDASEMSHRHTTSSLDQLCHVTVDDVAPSKPPRPCRIRLSTYDNYMSSRGVDMSHGTDMSHSADVSHSLHTAVTSSNDVVSDNIFCHHSSDGSSNAAPSSVPSSQPSIAPPLPLKLKHSQLTLHYVFFALCP